MGWEVEYTDEFEAWWEESFGPKADGLYDDHLRSLEQEGYKDG